LLGIAPPEEVGPGSSWEPALMVIRRYFCWKEVHDDGKVYEIDTTLVDDLIYVNPDQIEREWLEDKIREREDRLRLRDSILNLLRDKQRDLVAHLWDRGRVELAELLAKLEYSPSSTVPNALLQLKKRTSKKLLEIGSDLKHHIWIEIRKNTFKLHIESYTSRLILQI
jgi:hypothetical protein